MITRCYPSQEELRKSLKYNAETGDFTWINPTKYHPKMKQQLAGSIRYGRSGSRYIIISIGGLKLPAHQLAWIYTHGKQAEMIDHINGDGLDNRLSNLRACSHAENTRNHGKEFNSSGLPVGVRKLGGKYQARVTYNKRVYYLGVFDSVESARRAYLKNRNQLFGQFSRKEALI